MIWLGLAITTLSIPGWTSITIPAGWAVLSTLLPPQLWRRATPTLLHLFFYLFAAYAVLSLLWVKDYPNAAWRLWGIAIMLMAIHLGSALENLNKLWLGLGIGCAISSLLAVAQWLGLPYIMIYNESSPAGLHYNPSVHGMILALVGIALWGERRYLLLALLLPGLWLSHSRGAYAIFAAGLLLSYLRTPLLALAFGLVAMFYATLGMSGNDIERIAVWGGLTHFLSFFGQGAGSFTDLFIIYNSKIVQPEYAHNDYLQLLFEFGLGAAPCYLALGLALGRDFRGWPVLAACFIFGFISFPLFHPISLFVFSLVAGHATRAWPDLWPSYAVGRHRFVSRIRSWARRYSPASRKAVPVQLPSSSS